jgi:hypothetical protein
VHLIIKVLMVGSFDLFVASRFDTAPRLLWRHPVQPLISDVDYVPDIMAKKLSLKVGSSFDDYPELDTRCREAIRLGCVLLIGIDQYQRRAAASPSLSALVRARNAEQHKILSLPPPDVSVGFMDYQTLELCRISLLLFSCMVFFPLPPPTGVSFRIVTQLRHAIDGASAVMWNSRRNLLAWTLVLGGIGAFATVHRNWYVSTFERKALRHFDRWDDLKRVLETHLWWDSMFDKASERFWVEAQLEAETSLRSDISIPEMSTRRWTTAVAYQNS